MRCSGPLLLGLLRLCLPRRRCHQGCLPLSLTATVAAGRLPLSCRGCSGRGLRKLLGGQQLLHLCEDVSAVGEAAQRIHVGLQRVVQGGQAGRAWAGRPGSVWAGGRKGASAATSRRPPPLG